MATAQRAITAARLVLTFRLSGEPDVQVRYATRISIDGQGGVLVYSGNGSSAERLPLDRLENFRVLPVSPPLTVDPQMEPMGAASRPVGSP